MALTVPIEITDQFDVPAPYERVFQVLADVPFSVSHFPKLERLVDLGNEAYRWELEKLGTKDHSIGIVYGVTYTNNRDEGWVRWTPIRDVGNARIEGRWKLRAASRGTHIDFETRGELHLPLPALLKLLANRIARKEFEGLIRGYIANLKKTFAQAGSEELPS